MPLEEIAGNRGLKISTIYSHLADAVGCGLLDPHDFLPLDESEYEEIVLAITASYSVEDKKLKPVYDTLDETYNYGVIRCIVAGMGLE